MTHGDALDLILAECELANKKHSKFNSPHEGYAVILEELDELWHEIKRDYTVHKKGSPGLDKREAVQVAAMALRYLVDLC